MSNKRDADAGDDSSVFGVGQGSQEQRQRD